MTLHVHGENGEENMSDHMATTEAGRRYAAAHKAHYATKDLHEALELYRDVMAAHPNTQEAEYSRTQMHNIVKSVVPKEDLLAAQVELTLARLEREERSNLEPAALTLPASGLPS